MILLLCTISRNNEKRLKSWFNQLSNLLDLLLVNHDVEISLYENDSTDGTKALLKRCSNRLAEKCKTTLTSTDLGTEHLIGKEGARVKNIANARNACIEQASDLTEFDRIVLLKRMCCTNQKRRLRFFSTKETSFRDIPRTLWGSSTMLGPLEKPRMKHGGHMAFQLKK